jgi:two-component system, NtrC family, response regulator AtoC
MATKDETEEYAHRGGGEHEPLCASVVAGKTFLLDLPYAGRVTFGRDAEATVPLLVKSVSRLHVEITMRGGDAVVSDLGSRNGTFVNGVPLDGSRRVTKGDDITFGSVRVTLLGAGAIPSGVRPVSTRAAFVERLDDAIREGRDVRVLVVSLPDCWYEIDAVYAHLAALPPGVVVGILDVRTLAFGADERDATLSTVELEAVGLDIRAGLATASSMPQAGAETLLRAAVRSVSSPPPAPVGSTAVVASAAMRALYDEGLRIAKGPTTVLIVGETGVGKEVLARAIHEASGRIGPLVSVATAALAETHVESELFGQDPGFSAASPQGKMGIIEAASGGTLFLDEIGDVPLGLQAKLLRFLEDKAVRPVGALKERKVDVRVVAATHRDLEAAVAAGTFRHDLLYRLNACTLRVPPLRERPADFELLAADFVAAAAAHMTPPRSPPSIAPDTLDLLQSYPWPGNVRELRNVLERAVALAAVGEEISAHHLPEHVRDGRPVEAASAAGAGPAGADVRDDMKGYERRRIGDALERCQGNVRRAAELLGLPRRTLAYKIARLGLKTR